jgi:hypothetical protein
MEIEQKGLDSPDMRIRISIGVNGKEEISVAFIGNPGPTVKRNEMIVSPGQDDFEVGISGQKIPKPVHDVEDKVFFAGSVHGLGSAIFSSMSRIEDDPEFPLPDTKDCGDGMRRIRFHRGERA